MYADSFWPNLLVFVLGQFVACAYMATGRLLRGGSLMLAMLLLADFALVARFAYGAEHVTVAALVCMQTYALIEAGFYAFGRWYRRRGPVLQHRREQYQLALVAELHGEDSVAAQILARLCRRDPWDVESTLALATAQRRLGRLRRAGALLRRARRLDRQAKMNDLIFLESARLAEDRAATRGGPAQCR